MCILEDEYVKFEIDKEKLVFEWDEEKNHINFIKHGMKFQTASKIFEDENKLIRFDEEHSTRNEDRYNVIGSVGKVFFVVCVFRKNNVIRLISARLANATEKERYLYGENQNERY
jgi:uncharacterized DUF497 family protein